jgi:hypothetical protein
MTVQILPTCQQGVTVLVGLPAEPDVKPCGEPASYRVHWGDGEWFYLCQEHHTEACDAARDAKEGQA